MKIYHNPRCRKSRETLNIINEKGIKTDIVEYLKTPLTEKELADILEKLKMKPEQIIRKGEVIYKEKYKGKKYSDAEWIKILVNNPILIERPIVVDGNKAILGRPPINVLEIL